jgi:hypothetical protein
LATDEGYDGKATGQASISTYENDEYYGIDAVSGLVTKQRISLVVEPKFEEDVGYRFENFCGMAICGAPDGLELC